MLNVRSVRNIFIEGTVLSMLPELLSPWLDACSRVVARRVCSKWRHCISKPEKKTSMCAMAARNGHLKILQWARAN